MLTGALIALLGSLQCDGRFSMPRFKVPAVKLHAPLSIGDYLEGFVSSINVL